MAAWCGTIVRISDTIERASGCFVAKRARSRWAFSPRSPCRARSKKASRLGTRATVDIHTGRKRVLDYLVQPVLKTTSEAFRER